MDTGSRQVFRTAFLCSPSICRYVRLLGQLILGQCANYTQDTTWNFMQIKHHLTCACPSVKWCLNIIAESKRPLSPFEQYSCKTLLMSILQNLNRSSSIFFRKLFYTFRKGTGIAYGCALLNTRGESDSICSPFDQLSYTQGNLFSGTSTAVDKSNQFNLFFYLFKRTGFIADCHEIRGPRTIIFSLHTADNSYFHPALSFLIKVNGSIAYSAGMSV